MPNACRPSVDRRRCALLIAGVLALAGCGQKGPLLLPSASAAPTMTPASAASAAR